MSDVEVRRSRFGMGSGGSTDRDERLESGSGGLADPADGLLLRKFGSNGGPPDVPFFGRMGIGLDGSRDTDESLETGSGGSTAAVERSRTGLEISFWRSAVR